MKNKMFTLLFLLTAGPLGAAGLTDGQAIYTEHCIDCHLETAEGDDLAPDIRGTPQNNLRRALGGMQSMPEIALTPEEQAAVLNYLKSLDL